MRSAWRQVLLVDLHTRICIKRGAKERGKRWEFCIVCHALAPGFDELDGIATAFVAASAPIFRHSHSVLQGNAE